MSVQTIDLSKFEHSTKTKNPGSVTALTDPISSRRDQPSLLRRGPAAFRVCRVEWSFQRRWCFKIFFSCKYRLLSSLLISLLTYQNSFYPTFSQLARHNFLTFVKISAQNELKNKSWLFFIFIRNFFASFSHQKTLKRRPSEDFLKSFYVKTFFI